MITMQFILSSIQIFTVTKILQKYTRQTFYILIAILCYFKSFETENNDIKNEKFKLVQFQHFSV